MRISRAQMALFFLVLLLGGSAAGCGGSTVRAAHPDIPTATVQQGDLQLKVFTTGVLHTTRSSALTAPPVAGGTLQIIKLAKTGTAVRAGDVVLEFDPSQQEYTLGQNRSDLQQAEQEIVKAKADAEVQGAEDQTALLKAKYAVRQAELEVSKNELVSQIDAKKNLLALEEAKRALAQLHEDIQSHTASNQAAIALSEEKRNKARLAMQQAEENIRNMRIKSQIDGLVTVRGNRNSTGGFFFWGMTLPEYQVGDQANPGEIVAEVIDINGLEITAKVNEADRANLKTRQSVEVQLDALPDNRFAGKVQTISGMSRREFWDDEMQQKFDVSVRLDNADPRLRPGFGAKLIIQGEQVSRALSVPREALFERNGKTVVYAKQGSGFAPQEVKVRSFSEGRAILEGLPVGTVVALVNPESRTAAKPNPSSAANPALAPGAR